MRHWDRALWLTLSPLLDRALDLEPQDRGPFLAGVRADDPAVADALERALVEHERVLASAFLETPPLPAVESSPLAGSTVGAYTIERPLGMGGMGTVWLARRSDGRFEGAAAVKFLHLDVLDRIGQERFRREGTLLARLSHPHIARLFDAGVTDAGQPFLVLEYVEGTRIDRYAGEQRLRPEARIELVLQVCDAVGHAHANLVVHRDLKPSNVLVGAGGQVKLLDFGIATLLDQRSGDGRATVTLASGALTPEHAAPEQVLGGPVTTATDVYALGVLLYELLVGRHPTVPVGAASHAAILHALTEQEPLRPSDAAGRLAAGDPDGARILTERNTTRERLRRFCRGDLDTIVMKALKKDPAGRYQTVTAFAEDLRRYLRHEAVTARPDSVWYRTRKLAARHRLELGAAASIALALIAGTVIAVTQARASARDRDRAVEQLRRADATNDFSSFLLSQATPRGEPISNAELLAQGEALIARRFAGDAALRVHMLLTLADRYQENQQFDDWRRVLQRAYDEARMLTDGGLRAYATCAWAVQFAEQGDYSRALSEIAGALPIVSSADQAQYESGCRLLESIAARMSGDTDRAIAAAERAVALEDRPGGALGREIDSMATLAAAYLSGFQYAAADSAFRRVIDVLDRQGLGATRKAAVILNNWSVMLLDAGQHLPAAEVAARAVRTARTVDSDNGASLSMLTTYGVALAATGEHEAAVPVFDEALGKARVAGSPRRLISTLVHAIHAASDAGNTARAVQLLSEAERVLADDPSAYSTGTVDASAAHVARARGDRARAVELGRRAVATLETATPNGASLMGTQTMLARSLNEVGQFAEALAMAEESLAIATRRLSHLEHASGIGLALLEIAIARDGLGQSAAAAQATAEALEHLLAASGPGATAVERAEALRQRLRDAAGQPDPQDSEDSDGNRVVSLGVEAPARQGARSAHTGSM